MIAVLQLDSVSLSFLRRLLRAGKLPVFAELCREGRWHDLQTPADCFAAGAFHTLYSGVELVDHGLVYPFQWSARDQRVRYMRDLEAPAPVWDLLARHGRRTLVIDPYEGRPSPTVAGTIVSGWQFKDRVVLQRWSRPRGLGRRLEELFGPPQAAEEVFGTPSVAELLRRRRQLAAAPGRLADAAELLLARGEYDAAWFTFSAAHIAGHQFWDQSQLPAQLDAGERAALSGALERVYRAVDEALGRVLAALPPGTDVVLTSPVGMDVNTSRADLLPEMLAAVLAGRPAPGGRAGTMWRLRAAVPARVRSRAAALLPDRVALDLTARLETRGIDWSRTRAFALPADNQGYVRVNLRGREAHGIVDPADLPALVDEIEAGLSTFIDEDGAPCVARVEHTSVSLPAGAATHRLPDLVVHWRDMPATRLRGVYSPLFGAVTRHGRASGRSGNHTSGDAWALVVPRGADHREPSRAARVVDVAATVAARCGVRDGLPGEALLGPAGPESKQPAHTAALRSFEPLN